MAAIQNVRTVKPRARISPAEAKHRLVGNKLFMLLNTWNREEPCYANQLRRNFDLQRFVHKDTFSSKYMAVIRNLCTVKPRARISPAEAKHRL